MLTVQTLACTTSKASANRSVPPTHVLSPSGPRDRLAADAETLGAGEPRLGGGVAVEHAGDAAVVGTTTQVVLPAVNREGVAQVTEPDSGPARNRITDEISSTWPMWDTGMFFR